MPTLAQLEAESWWGREVITAELDWLGDEICRRTGRPRYAAGTKGDEYHLRGAHRSQEWIVNSAYCTNRTYTVQSGLTAEQLRHIAGFDFTPGSGEAMLAQCQRIYAAVRSGTLEEVREFYGNVDGDQIVDGWNNIEDRIATSDSSHLWHWHLTIDRRRLTDRSVMQRILVTALGEDNEMLADERAWLHEVWNLLRNGLRDATSQTASGGIPIAYLPRAFYDVGVAMTATEAREVARDAFSDALVKGLAATNDVNLSPEQVAELAAQANAAVSGAVDAVMAKLDQQAAEAQRRETEREAGLQAQLDAERGPQTGV